MVNGKLIPPHMNQLQQAMDDTAKLQAMHAQLKIAQHREMKWRNNPEGALALQPKISQIEDRLGSAEKIRQDYLAQNMPELKAVYADTARTAAPSVEQLKAQWAQKPEDQPAPQQLVTTPPTPALESNSLADQLKKRQGFDYFSSQPLSYNLPQNQTSYL